MQRNVKYQEAYESQMPHCQATGHDGAFLWQVRPKGGGFGSSGSRQTDI